jgi:pimeloyl-ACP methyl ester carboxylesterase
MVAVRGRAPVWTYEAAGPPGAPTMMLLHGLGASAALNWFPAFAALSRDFRVIAPDHRGHGRTPAGDEPFTLAGCADDAFAVADALGVDQFVAVGYSMGGPIAQLMWRSRPGRVAGLILAATSRDFGGRIRERLAFQALPLVLVATRLPTSAIIRDRVLALLAPRLTPSMREWALDELRRGDSRRILEAAIELGKFSSRPWLGSVDVPTSVVVTMKDQLVPVQRQLELARVIDASVAAFVDGDHYAIGGTASDFVPVLNHECHSVTRRTRSRCTTPASYWNLLSS